LKDRNGVGITGGRGAAPIWAQFMLKATEGDPRRPFLQPAGMRYMHVHAATGAPADENDADAMRVVLKE
ncbi:MAG: carboxypeptidase, partial [Desulfatitalea sp.]|nr:carboxypeptidase [Desulfatitalea sp.]